MDTIEADMIAEEVVKKLDTFYGSVTARGGLVYDTDTIHAAVYEVMKLKVVIS